MLRRVNSSVTRTAGTPTMRTGAAMMFPSTPACSVAALSVASLRACSSASGSTTNSPTSPLFPSPAAAAAASASSTTIASPFASSASIEEQGAAAAAAAVDFKFPPTIQQLARIVADVEAASSGATTRHLAAAAAALGVPSDLLAPKQLTPAEAEARATAARTRSLVSSHVLLVHVTPLAAGDGDDCAVSFFHTTKGRVVVRVDSLRAMLASEDLKFALTADIAAACDNDMLAVLLPAEPLALKPQPPATETDERRLNRVVEVLCGRGFNAVLGPCVDEMAAVLLQHEDLVAKELKAMKAQRKQAKANARNHGSDYDAPAEDVGEEVEDASLVAAATAAVAAATAAVPLRERRAAVCRESGVDFAEIEVASSTASSTAAAAAAGAADLNSDAAAAALRLAWNYLQFAGANRKVIFKSHHSGTAAFIELLHDLVVPTAHVIVVHANFQMVNGKELIAISTYNVRTRQKNGALGPPDAAMRLLAALKEDELTVVVPTHNTKRELIHSLAAGCSRSRRYIALAYPSDFSIGLRSVSSSDPQQFALAAERIGAARTAGSGAQYTLEDFEREALKLGGTRFRSFVRKHKLTRAAEDGDLGAAIEEADAGAAVGGERGAAAAAAASAAAAPSFRPSVPEGTDATSSSSLEAKNNWDSIEAMRALNNRVKGQLKMIYDNPLRIKVMNEMAAAMRGNFVVMVWKARAANAYLRDSNPTAAESYMERLAFMDHSGECFLPPVCAFSGRGGARLPSLDGYDTLVVHGAKEALLLLSTSAGHGSGCIKEMDPELLRFLRRGGRVWCTAVAEYALTGFRAEYPRLALHDVGLRYGAPTAVTDYSWHGGAGAAGMPLHSEVSCNDVATRLGSSPAASPSTAAAAASSEAAAAAAAVASSSPLSSTAMTGTTAEERAQARECAQSLRVVFMKQLDRATKQAQLASLLNRMDAALVHGEIERNGIFVDSIKAHEQSALARRELAQVNQLLNASVPAGMPVDAVSKNMFSWDNWSHVQAFFFGGTIRIGQQRRIDTPGDVASFLVHLAFHARKLNALRDSPIIDAAARYINPRIGLRSAGVEDSEGGITSVVAASSSSSGSNGNNSDNAVANRNYGIVRSWLYEQQPAEQPVAASSGKQRATSASKQKGGGKQRGSPSSSSTADAADAATSTAAADAALLAPEQSPFRFILFDLETTGLDGETDRIVEYCFYEPATGKMIQSLVNPMRKIPIDSQRVHKISDEMVRDAPTFRAQSKKIAQFLGLDHADAPQQQHKAAQQQPKQKIILMAHHAPSLDQPILLKHLAAAGVQVDHSQLLIADSLPLLVAVKNQWGLTSLRLGALATHLGVTPDDDGSNSSNKASKAAASTALAGLHRADADVKLLWNVLKKALRIRSAHQILPLIADSLAQGERHCFSGHCTELVSAAQFELGGVVHSYWPGISDARIAKMKDLTIASGQVLGDFVQAGCNEALLYQQKLKLERAISVFDRDDETLGTVHADQCIRQEISLASTATGRTASKNPNCQNIPKDDKSRIREVFVSRYGPERGWMIEIDFKQLEIAVLGLLSQDPSMVRDLEAGVDFHLKRCQVMFNRSYEELVRQHKAGDKAVKAYRQQAKTVSFQRMYGAGATSIAKTAKLDLDIVRGMIEQEEREYPQVSEMHSVTRSMCLRQGNEGTTTHFVYELPTGARVSIKAADVALSMPAVKNYPIQSYGAELVSMSLARLLREFVLLDRFRGRACIVNFVHDSVWLDCHDSCVAEVVTLVSAVMSSLHEQLAREFPGAPNNVRFGVSASIGRDLCDGVSLQQWEADRAAEAAEKLKQQQLALQAAKQQQPAPRSNATKRGRAVSSSPSPSAQSHAAQTRLISKATSTPPSKSKASTKNSRAAEEEESPAGKSCKKC